jgi:hypothetical protein
VAATKGKMARHVIDPGEALTNESEDATWTSHGSKGPTSDTKSSHAPGMDQRAHRAATQKKYRPGGDPRGPANPRIARTDLGAFDPGLPHVGCSLVTCFTPGCLGVIWASEQALSSSINRRGGAPISHTPVSHSPLSFSFQG